MVNTITTILGTIIDLEPCSYKGFRTITLEFNKVPVKRMYDHMEWMRIVDLIKSWEQGILIRVECVDGLIIQLMTEPSTEQEDPVSTSKPVDCYVKHGRLVAKRGVIYSTQLYIETMSKTLVIEDVHIRMDRYWEELDDE